MWPLDLIAKFLKQCCLQEPLLNIDLNNIFQNLFIFEKEFCILPLTYSLPCPHLGIFFNENRIFDLTTFKTNGRE
jgi:hypothetical protein